MPDGNQEAALTGKTALIKRNGTFVVK